MKKLMSIMAAAALTFSLAACGSKTETSEQEIGWHYPVVPATFS